MHAHGPAFSVLYILSVDQRNALVVRRAQVNHICRYAGIAKKGDTLLQR